MPQLTRQTVFYMLLAGGMASCVLIRWVVFPRSWITYITSSGANDDQLSDAEWSIQGDRDNVTPPIVTKDDGRLDDVTPDRRDISICIPDVRLKQRADSCAEIDHQSLPTPGSWTTIDNVHKAVWILVPKAGSRSWLDYFARSINRTESVNRNREMYRELGINFTNLHDMPEEVNSLYKDYFKFTVVRHPLQRFVSAYFEIRVRFKIYLDECQNVRRRLGERPASSCRDEPILSFQEFAVASAKGYLPGNAHWRSLLLTVKPCMIDLDLIAKSETGEYDTLLVNNRLEIIPDHKVDRLHLGAGHVAEDYTGESDRIEADLTRYDTILFDLQEQHPETFKWVLDYYAIDMEMFGYTWDVESGSGCGYKQHQCC